MWKNWRKKNLICQMFIFFKFNKKNCYFFQTERSMISVVFNWSKHRCLLKSMFLILSHHIAEVSRRTAMFQILIFNFYICFSMLVSQINTREVKKSQSRTNNIAKSLPYNIILVFFYLSHICGVILGTFPKAYFQMCNFPIYKAETSQVCP